MIRRISGTAEDIALLSEFIDNAGDSLATFRYFSTRPFGIVANHLYTILLLNDADGKPIAYGHLDPEGTNVWLGICVSAHAAGKGFGKMIMKDLLGYAKNNGLKEIILKVDAGNPRAIALYEKCGFHVTGGEEGKYLLMKYISAD